MDEQIGSRKWTADVSGSGMVDGVNDETPGAGTQCLQ
jgi:hypothetical protein